MGRSERRDHDTGDGDVGLRPTDGVERISTGESAEARTAVIAVGRPTFDVESASSLVVDALDLLRSLDLPVVGDATIHTSADRVDAAGRHWPNDIDTLVVVFATFTDSTVPAAAVAAARAANRCGRPLRVVLWSFPEPRLEARLVWNSLCGAILTNYRLRNEGLDVELVHRRPDDVEARAELVAALSRPVGRVARTTTGDPLVGVGIGADAEAVDRIVAGLERATIGIIGRPPAGFEPCQRAPSPSPTGTRFEDVPLDALFDAADAVDRSSGQVTPVCERVEVRDLVAIGDRSPDGLHQSLRLHDGLRQLADARGFDALAVRCWPECFTRWGGAACAPLALLSDAGLPSACEADANGALTGLLLELATGRAAFLADLVDIDREANTCTFWHCGVAPPSLANPAQPIVAIDHPNRRIPLALHFGLAPGPMTICRLSRSGGRLRLVLGIGEALDQPPPFAGTSGTVRFQTPVDVVLRRLTDEAVEHHLVVAAGDHRPILAAVADRLDLPLIVVAD